MSKRRNFGPVASRIGPANLESGPRWRYILEAELSQLLTSIATLLVSSGYAYGQMSKLARIAFVDAAIEACSDGRRKFSIAQIAAATGLTRTEVSSIVRKKKRRQRDSDPKNRAVNVAAGWLTDRQYCSAKKVPRALPFKGGTKNFSNLVRKYGGDVPARAMLREMQRLGMVISDSREFLWLARRQAPIAAVNVKAIQAIEPWVALMRDAVRGSEKQDLSSNTSQIDLYFDSVPQVLAVLGDIKRRRLAFVEGISELGVRPANKKNYSMRVTIAVAVARPTKTGTAQRRRN
jgi:hypothetical protein